MDVGLIVGIVVGLAAMWAALLVVFWAFRPKDVPARELVRVIPDLIPELVPGLGPLDDVIVAIVALRYVRRRLGVDGLRSRWPGSADAFALLVRVVGSGSVRD